MQHEECPLWRNMPKHLILVLLHRIAHSCGLYSYILFKGWIFNAKSLLFNAHWKFSSNQISEIPFRTHSGLPLWYSQSNCFMWLSTVVLKWSFHLIGTYSSFISSFAGEWKKMLLVSALTHWMKTTLTNMIETGYIRAIHKSFWFFFFWMSHWLKPTVIQNWFCLVAEWWP